MRISDWSSDVCSSDLGLAWYPCRALGPFATRITPLQSGDGGGIADLRLGYGTGVMARMAGQASFWQQSSARFGDGEGGGFSYDADVGGIIPADQRVVVTIAGPVHCGQLASPALAVGDRKSTRLNSSH